MASFSTSSFQNAIKCAFCQCNFTFTVKLIPDCGNSICGKCYEELKDSLLKSNEYECKVCKVWHVLPEAGLVDNLALLKIVQPGKNVVQEKAKELNSLISETRVKLGQMLDLYDVDAYCKGLKDSVKRSLEIKIQHLRGEAADQIRKIDDFCSESKLFKNFSGQRRRKTARKCFIPGDKFDLSLNEQIANLKSDFGEFSDEWNGYFTSSIQSLTSQEMDSALEEIRRLESRITIMEREFKSFGFGNGHLRWKDNEMLLFKDNWLGELTRRSSTQSGNDPSGKLIQTIDCKDGSTNQVVFLPDAYLASISSNKSVTIWRGCRQINSTMTPEALPTSVAGLANGLLAIGFINGSIQLRDLNTNEHVRELAGHKKTVFSLRALSNGNLASVSYDNTIKIWNPNVDQDNLLITIDEHNNKGEPIQLGILPNGNLITCSNNNTGKTSMPSTIKVWNPRDGELVQTIQFSFRTATALLVLSDGRVAIGLRGGIIKLVDLTQEEEPKTLNDPRKSAVLSIVQLSDGTLLSSGPVQSSRALIDVWDLKAGKHLKSIESGHSCDVTSLSLHPNGKILASSSIDCTIKLWSIEHLLSGLNRAESNEESEAQDSQ